MATWKIEPSWKKSLIERFWYGKGDNRFIAETGWRWGEFTCETEDDKPPLIESGDNLWACGYDVEMVEMTDGCWEEHDMDDCDEETQAWLEEFFEEGNSYYDLEDNGWILLDSECIIDCDPVIERIDE